MRRLGLEWPQLAWNIVLQAHAAMGDGNSAYATFQCVSFFLSSFLPSFLHFVGTDKNE